MEAFERFEYLLLSTPYDGLSAEDQQWLTKLGVTKVAYAQQREVLLSAREQLRVQGAPPAASPVLREALATRRGALARVRFSKSWQLAAASIIGILVGYGLSFYPARPVEASAEQVRHEQPPVQLRTDTVFLEKEVLLPPKIVYRERVLRDTVYVMPVASTAEQPPEILPTTRQEDLPNFSRNAQQTESLLKVLVEVY